MVLPKVWGGLRCRNTQIVKIEKYVKVMNKKYPNKLEYASVPNFVSHILNKAMEKKS